MAAKKIVTQTLKEFQAWLDGVEELQPKGWTPDSRQWAKIRKRIANILTEVTIPTPQMQPIQSGQHIIPNIGMPPQVPSSIPVLPTNIEMSPAAKALLGNSPQTPDSSSDDASSFA